MATVTSLNLYSFAFNGFVFGGAGNGVQILSIEGLEDLPKLRVQDDNRGYADGMFTGRDFYSNRTLTFTVQILASETNSMVQNLEYLQTALQPQQTGTGILQFQLPNADLQRVNARVRRRSIKIDPDFTYGKAVGMYEFFCPDPLIYDDTLQTVDISQSSSAVGRTYNRTYNMSFGGGSASNLVINSGWATTYPTITINGPVINPQISNATTGNFLLINYSLQTSDIMVIDTNLRTVTLNGVNRRSLLDNTSSWFAASPGTTILNFRGTGTSGSTTCVVSWRNAYI